MAEVEDAVPAPGGPDAAVVAVEAAIVGLRRSMCRPHLGQLVLRGASALGAEVSLQDLLVIDAIEQGSGVEGGGVTVGLVADRAALEPSRAGRVVAGAVQAGLVRRVASQSDGRRTCLELTDLGQTLASVAHTTRLAAFTEAMRDWSSQDRETFAELLIRFNRTTS